MTWTCRARAWHACVVLYNGISKKGTNPSGTTSVLGTRRADMLITDNRTVAVGISPDDCSESPREWDNLSTIYTWEDNGGSVDDGAPDSPQELISELLVEHLTAGELLSAIVTNRLATKDDGIDDMGTDELADIAAEWCGVPSLLAGRMVLVPVYKLEHSGTAYSTSDFGDPWDSGMVGFAFVTADTIRKEYAGVPFDKALETATEVTKGEVDVFNQYVNNDVYIATKYDSDGNEVDSLCDIYVDGKSDVPAEMQVVYELSGKLAHELFDGDGNPRDGITVDGDVCDRYAPEDVTELFEDADE